MWYDVECDIIHTHIINKPVVKKFNFPEHVIRTTNRMTINGKILFDIICRLIRSSVKVKKLRRVLAIIGPPSTPEFRTSLLPTSSAITTILIVVPWQRLNLIFKNRRHLSPFQTLQQERYFEFYF